ncbi:MAG: AEC family transporter [Nitrospirae bacterium]|nr:AEC family transporter [Nitrospirota bacterium]
MFGVLLQMAVMIAVGVGWRVLKPLGLEADATRRAVTGMVYAVLLPALVLDVLWHAPMGLDTVRIAIAAAAGVLVALALAHRLYAAWGTPATVTGAMLLAAAFGNVTYLGLPVLTAALGPWAGGVAIQYDLFACTPLLLTVGILVARRFGGGAAENPLLALLKVPPLWAALLAVALHLAGVAPLPWLHGLLSTLGAGVVPLMLVSLGMGLTWASVSGRGLLYMAPALGIQLLVTPALVWGVALLLGLEGPTLTAVVLEAAMPCMVLGIVICDRYGLDTGLYAGAVSLSTLLSLATLPMWFHLAG